MTADSTAFSRESPQRSENWMMKRAKGKFTAPLVIAVTGIAFGAFSAVVGLAIDQWNVKEHGASYLRYRYELFALPALPGMIIAERRFGADFQLGEIQLHRASVIGWNTLLYGAIASLGFLFHRHSPRVGERVDTTTNNTEQ